jgi:hypothetical protein
MHATYLFLMSGIDEGIDALSEATTVFNGRYQDHYCDENNWCSVMRLSTEEGSVHFNGDYGVGAGDISFEGDWRLAASIVYNDLGSYMELGVNPYGVGTAGNRQEEVDAMSAKQLLDDGLRRASAELATRYGLLASQRALIAASSPAGAGQSNSSTRDSWKRRRLSEVVEAISDSEHSPFANHLCTPYQHRCFDLTDGEAELPFSILAVDIHT